MAKISKKLKVDPLGFHRAVQLMKDLEQDNPDLVINDMPVSHFLQSISDIDTSKASISVRVKVAILKTNGEEDPDPGTVPDDTKMSDFNFSEMQLIRLAGRFTDIAKSMKAGAKVGAADVRDCEKVKDCIDLVTKAAS